MSGARDAAIAASLIKRLLPAERPPSSILAARATGSGDRAMEIAFLISEASSVIAGESVNRSFEGTLNGRYGDCTKRQLNASSLVAILLE